VLRALVTLGVQTLVRREYSRMGPPWLLVNSHAWLRSSRPTVQDPYLADSTARSTAEHVKGSYRAHPLDGVAHWVPETARGEVTRLIHDHIFD
jgi:hypothetical protein